MLNQCAIELHNNWYQRAQDIDTTTLHGVFEKFTTLFVIYNNLYNNVEIALIANNIPVPNRIYDNKLATNLVLKLLGGEEIMTALAGNNRGINIMVQLIRDEEFYINLHFGERQRNEDLLILAGLESNDPDRKALAILKVIYHVRCNLVHGHKNFVQYQERLLTPLTNILLVLVDLLYEELNR